MNDSFCKRCHLSSTDRTKHVYFSGCFLAWMCGKVKERIVFQPQEIQAFRAFYGLLLFLLT
ncbi:MAG TPA: hypothetical protein DCM27_01715 [Rhodospirillaceae bacterium]|nr:hypothetical protein [Rhodospirillaceae bacterium]